MMRYFAIILSLLLVWRLSPAQTDSLIHSGYHINQGKALADSGLYEQALKEFKYIDPRDTNYVLSLAEMASVYLSNKQYDEAITTAAKGLVQPSPYRSRLLITQGMAFTEKGLYDQAQAIFETGLKEFPFYPSFTIQFGRMLYVQKKYREAEKLFFETLETTPFNSTSHLYLGILSMLRGEKVHGMMAMGIYLTLSNTANNHLITLEHFVKNELTDEFTVPPTSENSFIRLDEIIRSKIAMEDEYKTKIPINAGIVRQYQLLFDQLTTQEFTGNDPWLAFYLPIYKSLIKANVHEAFVYHILESTSIKQVPEWASKNKKALEQFYSVVNNALFQVRVKKTLGESWGYQEPVSCWYNDDYLLESIGQKNSKDQRVGYWYYFNDNGGLRAQGKYDVLGNKVGLWKYYNTSGQQADIENFETGERQHFTDQGVLYQKYTLKNNLLEGDLFNYHECGSIHERVSYRKGKREGVGEVYSIQGTLVERFLYVEDSLHGKYQSFYEAGQPRQESMYVRGKLNGTFTSYHRNGKIASQGDYVMGNAIGQWKIYHDNGQVKEIGEYKEDLPVGEFNFYDRHGQLIEKRNYNEKGSLHGEDVFYHDGVMQYRLIFRDHVLTESMHYDRQGNVISNFVETNGSLQGKAYFPTGELRSEFQYTGGKATGTWRYFYRNGNLESVYEYLEDALNGKVVDFYENKTIKSIAHYTEGKLQGFYEGFHENGKHSVTGWYQDGLRQQRWVYYYPSGVKKTEDYYLNDVVTGSSFHFDPEGKVISEVDHRDGRVIGIKRYNEKGELNSSVSTIDGGNMTVVSRFKSGAVSHRTVLLCGSYHGKMLTNLPNGKPYLVQPFMNDKLDGNYENYSPDGSRECIGQYSDGNSSGIWIWYYPNQTIEVIGKYVDDERDSLWTYYHENGKVSSITNYHQGRKHGVSKIFSPDGMLILEKQYDNGDLIAYRTSNNSDTIWVPFSGTGTVRVHYPNGVLAMEEKYVNGQMDGERKIYFVSGTVYSLDNYSMGLSEGASIINYPNGKNRFTGNYEMDQPVGRWEFYGLDGKIERTENYSVGLLHGPSEFFSNGKKVNEVKFWYGLPTE